MIQFIYASDVHLTDYIWVKRKSIKYDAYFAWRRLIDLCLSRKCPLVLGGDIFDSINPPTRAIEEFRLGMDRLKKAGLKCYYIQGDHDYCSQKSLPAAISSWPIHLHAGPELLEQGDERLWLSGLDWTPDLDLRRAMTGKLQGRILVTHQTWEEFMPFGSEGSILDMLELFQCELMLAGDVHLTKAAKYTRPEGRPLGVLSAGSLSLRRIVESPDKFAFRIYTDENKQLHSEALPIPQLRRIIHLEDAESIPSIREGLITRPGYAEPVVVVQLDSPQDPLRREAEHLLGDIAQIFCSYRTKEKKDVDRSTAVVAQNSLECVKRLAEIELKDNPLAKSLLLAAIDSPNNRSAAIDDWIERAMGTQLCELTKSS